MCKGKAAGVERLPLYKSVIRIIEEITQKRVAYIFHMHTNLMCPASVKCDKEQGAVFIAVVAEPAVAGAGILTPLRIHAAFDGGAFRSGDWPADTALLFCQA